jgi:hypothetical protein
MTLRLLLERTSGKLAKAPSCECTNPSNNSVAFAHGSQITLMGASFVLLQSKAPLERVLDVLMLSTKIYRRQKVCSQLFMARNTDKLDSLILDGQLSTTWR